MKRLRDVGVAIAVAIAWGMISANMNRAADETTAFSPKVAQRAR